MSIGDGEWRLWRTGEPFSQRFSGRFEADGNTIVGRWERAANGENYETDFDLMYRKVKPGRRALASPRPAILNHACGRG